MTKNTKLAEKYSCHDAANEFQEDWEPWQAGRRTIITEANSNAAGVCHGQRK